MSSFWPDLDPPSASAEASVRRLSASVAVATGLATTGRSIDLAGLEMMIGRLCAEILDLAPDESSGIKPSLLALDRDIAGLITLMVPKT